MKRFYKAAAAVALAEGYGVALDGKPMQTPARRPLALPSRALAEAIAAEWQAQQGDIRPLGMPLMRLAATAIDRVAGDRDRVVDEIAAYASADLVCYRAENDSDLAQRQAEVWQPLLDWLNERYRVRLVVTGSIVAVRQPAEALARLRSVVSSHDEFALAALHALSAATGSLVIALAVLEGRIGSGEAFQASQLDELFQAQRWGHDPEAIRRREDISRDIAGCADFLRLLGG